MKKIKLALLFSVAFFVSNAQIFVELAPNISLSTDNYIEYGKSHTVDYGVGANLIAGYL